MPSFECGALVFKFSLIYKRYRMLLTANNISQQCSNAAMSFYYPLAEWVGSLEIHNSPVRGKNFKKLCMEYGASVPSARASIKDRFGLVP